MSFKGGTAGGWENWGPDWLNKEPSPLTGLGSKARSLSTHCASSLETQGKQGVLQKIFPSHTLENAITHNAGATWQEYVHKSMPCLCEQVVGETFCLIFFF